MTKTEHTTTRSLIGEIEAKDRRFRTWQSIFMALVFMVLVGIVYVQARTLAGVQQQLDQQRQLLQAQKENTEEIKTTTAKLSQQLDCIAQFFASRNRADAVITDLEQCTIVRPDGSIVEPDFTPRTPPRNAAGAPGTTSQPQQPATIDPNGPGLAPLNPQQPTTPETPDPESENPPVEILGIPVCVPFTNACVR